ncbi:MAG: hypothetical protein RO469_17270 [Thermincola sp.]|jgi:uncharacterized protein YebE (UPF0316 family)|nr:hypothetical protein [Thermincola sp.]
MLNTIIDLSIVLALNVFSTCLGNLKTTFLAQKAVKPVYITTFIDAIVFVYAFKLITSSSGYGYILAFALGKILGVFLANQIEKKLAIGLVEIEVYKHLSAGKILADNLRNQGYSVTTTVGYGIEGKELILKVILPRKQFPDFHELMERNGKVDMSVKSISKTYGKVGRINLTTE